MFIFVEFRVSRNFSKNRLASDELPPCDTCCSSYFLGFFKEPPGGEHHAASRHK